MIIAVIADTHGLLRETAIEALRGCVHIVHAGDVGRPEVLASLREIAPVTAVRGNVDTGEWARDLPDSATVEVAGVKLHVTHDVATLHIEPARVGVEVVVTGHSHKLREERLGGVLYINPGGAGPRRFKLPVTLMRLHVDGRDLRVEVVELT
jgi:putative phosphoesterase